MVVLAIIHIDVRFESTAPPNGLRLSGSAKLEHSQREFHNTACRTSSEFVDDGRRQLQARVRPQRITARVAPMHRRRQNNRAQRKAQIESTNGHLA